MLPTWWQGLRFVMLTVAIVAVAPPAGARERLRPPTVTRIAPAPGATGFGSALAWIADVDGDDIDEIVVGAPGSGHVYVVSGATRAVLDDIADPAGTKLSFGSSVASVGDIDGDGEADFAVGAPGGQGRALAYSGATGVLIRQLAPAAVAHRAFGRSVTAAGDVSGDGVPDIVVGALGDKPGRGIVSAFSGATGTQLWWRQEASASFGAVVAATPDVSGDGITDFLVSGARVQVLSGRSGAVLRSIADPRPRRGDRFGAVLAAVGDQNEDGRADHLVGEPGADRLHLFSGRDGALMRSMSLPAPARGQPVTLARVGDKDGNRLDEFWVGIAADRAAYLLNGRGSVLSAVEASSARGSFGSVMATLGVGVGVGKAGADPAPELVVGDPAERGGGAAYLVQTGPTVVPTATAAVRRKPWLADLAAAATTTTTMATTSTTAATSSTTTTTTSSSTTTTTTTSSSTTTSSTTTTSTTTSSATTIPIETTSPTTTGPTETTTGPTETIRTETSDAPTTTETDATGGAPATATLPKPFSVAAVGDPLPNTGGGHQGAGLVALVLGLVGLALARRLRPSSGGGTG